MSKVADEVGAKVEQLVEMVDDNILDYCTLDKGVRMCSLASLSTLLAEGSLNTSACPVRRGCYGASVPAPEALRFPAGQAAKGEEDAGGEGGGVPGRAAGECKFAAALCQTRPVTARRWP